MDILLSTQFLASLLIVVAIGLVVRSMMFYTREAQNITPKLKAIEKELETWRAGTADQRAEVEQLQARVTPMEEKEGQLRQYYESLLKIQADLQAAQDQKENTAKAAREKKIERKKMGFETF